MFQLPIERQPDDAAQELLLMSNKAVEGVQVLSRIAEENLMIGACEKEAVFRNDHITLYRYRSANPPRYATPVLIVYALVNRPYMLDLQEDRSLIRQLMEHGLDVYLIDWGYPQRNDRWLTLEDYINDYIASCVDFILDAHQLESLTVMGVCQGGVFSLCYAALYPEKVNRIVTVAAGVDFHVSEGVINHWMRYRDPESNIDIDLVADTLGNIPGSLMNFGFVMLKPYELGLQKYMTFLDSIENEAYSANFLRMEKWIFDNPDQSGEAWREYINEFYVHNRLIKGETVIGGQRVDLKKITMPVLNLFAEHDHLVPPASSQALRDYIGTEDYTEASFPVGHVGMYVSRKVQDMLPSVLENWLNRA
jgi:polyhydroxyalkanoate synthase